MSDEEKSEADHPERRRDEPTKPAGTDVAPPGDRVDDEVDGDKKTTQRQE